MIQQKQKMLRTADHSLGLLTLRMIPKITSDGRLSPVPSPEKPHVCSTETEPTGGSRLIAVVQFDFPALRNLPLENYPAFGPNGTIDRRSVLRKYYGCKPASNRRWNSTRAYVARRQPIVSALYKRITGLDSMGIAAHYVCCG